MSAYNLSQPCLFYIPFCDNAGNNKNYLLLPKEALGHKFLFRGQVKELCPILSKTIHFSFLHSDICVCLPWRLFEWRISFPHVPVNNSGDAVTSTAVLTTVIFKPVVLLLELRLQFFCQSCACSFFYQRQACIFSVRAMPAVFCQSYACSFSVRATPAVFLLELRLQFFCQSCACNFFLLKVGLHFFVRATPAVFCQIYACSFSVIAAPAIFSIRGTLAFFLLDLLLHFSCFRYACLCCQNLIFNEENCLVCGPVHYLISLSKSKRSLSQHLPPKFGTFLPVYTATYQKTLYCITISVSASFLIRLQCFLPVLILTAAIKTRL